MYRFFNVVGGIVIVGLFGVNDYMVLFGIVCYYMDRIIG